MKFARGEGRWIFRLGFYLRSNRQWKWSLLLRTRFVQRVIRPRRQRTVENLFKLAGLLSLFLSRVIILPLADESDASPDNLESESKCRWMDKTGTWKKRGHYFSRWRKKLSSLAQRIGIPTTRNTRDSRDRSRIRAEKRNIWNSEGQKARRDIHIYIYWFCKKKYHVARMASQYAFETEWYA